MCARKISHMFTAYRDVADRSRQLLHESVISIFLRDSPNRLDTDSPPLCVDLDGTLTTSDTLIESVFILIKQSLFPVSRSRTIG